MEVPSRLWYIPSPGLCWERAALMATPGAVRSGLSAPVPVSGPTLENQASWSCLSTAPTVSALAAVPGVPMVVPLLPAAMTKRVSCCAERASTARVIGSRPSVRDESPRLMLMMSAPDSAAHCMPAMIQES